MRPPFSRAVAGLVLALSATAWADPASLNLQQNLAKTKAKLAGGQQADILVIGDSLSFTDNCYLETFRNLLQANYGNAGAGYQAFSQWTGGAINANNWGGIVSDDITPYYGLDGLWIQSDTQHQIGYLQPRSPNIELQYVAQPGGGQFRPYVFLNGQPQYLSDPINTASATKEVRTWNYQIPNYTPGMQIFYDDLGVGSVTLLGENNTTTNPGIRVHRAANGGYTVGHFLHRDASFDEQLGLIHPDMVMIMLGANDAGASDGPQFAANMTQLINRIHATIDSDIVLVTPYDLSPALDPSDLHYQRVVLPDEQLANSLGVGFINLHDYAGDYSFWMSHNYLSDGIHQMPLGGQYLGNLLYNAFLTDGASLVPEPACLALLAPALLVIRRRRQG